MAQTTTQNTQTASSGQENGYDPNRYRLHLKDLDLTPEEQDAVLDALWYVMASFAELGFASNPIATNDITCGQLLSALFSAAQDDADSVNYTQSKTQTPSNTAEADIADLAGGQP